MEPEVNPALNSLAKDFDIVPPLGSGLTFYANITGFFRGDLNFYNITPPHLERATSSPEWKTHTLQLTAGMNMTELAAKVGTWGWSAPDKFVLSVLDKARVDLQIQEDITFMNVRPRVMFTSTTHFVNCRVE